MATKNKIMKALSNLKPLIVLYVLLNCMSCDEKPDLPDFKPIEGRYSARVATDWMNLATEMVKSRALPPPPTIRIFAYSSLTLYESQLPEMKDHQSMYTFFSGQQVAFNANGRYYGPAAANSAMAAILRKFNPAAANIRTIDSLESVYNAFFKNVTDADRLNESIDYGIRVADAIFEWSKSDGFSTPCPAWVLPVGPGLWEPTPPGFFPATGACQGNVRTFLKDITKLADPGPPPAFSLTPTSEYYKSADEILQYSKKLTRKDSLLASSWRDIPPVNYNTPSHMNKLLTIFLSSKTSFLNEVVVVYAKHNIAMFDAINSVFAAKFKYNQMRPITYIRREMSQSNFNTIIPTLQHPSYPSALAGVSSAGAGIWEKALGAEYAFTDQTQDKLYGSFAYNSIQDFILQISEQRISSGINFRFSVDAGKQIGKKIAEQVNQLPFKIK